MHLAKKGILVFLLGFFVCSAAQGGAITGSVAKRETAASLSGVVVKACPEGRAFCTSVISEQDGRFRIDDLSGGLYSVFVGASRSSRPQVVSVTVAPVGQAQVDFRLGPSVEVEGDSWVQPYPVFYQSFRATGLGITNLVLKGYGPERAVHVQVLEGEGITGKPIGPSRRTIPFGGEDDAAVFWSGGEIPTTPGKAYTLKLSADKAMTWIPAMAGRGNVYPLGQAYFGSEARPLSDLGFMLGEENDNLSVSYAVAAGRRAIFVRAVGQTFTARSNDIIFASACLERATPQASYVRFSIHKDGPKGKQIGPSKGTSIEHEASAAW